LSRGMEKFYVDLWCGSLAFAGLAALFPAHQPAAAPLLNGARQTGKSTLVRIVAAAEIRNLPGALSALIPFTCGSRPVSSLWPDPYGVPKVCVPCELQR